MPNNQSKKKVSFAPQDEKQSVIQKYQAHSFPLFAVNTVIWWDFRQTPFNLKASMSQVNFDEYLVDF